MSSSGGKMSNAASPEKPWSKAVFAGRWPKNLPAFRVTLKRSGLTKSRPSEDDAMTRIRGKGIAATLMLSGAGLTFLLFAQPGRDERRRHAGTPRTAVLKPPSSPYIDGHVHIDQHDPEGSVQLLLRAMDGLTGAKAFIQTEPYGPDNPARWD